MGYVGGLLALVVGLTTLVNPEVPWFGFEKEAGENIRATNLLVAVWYAVFSIPFFLWVKERRPVSKPGPGLVRAALSQLASTLSQIRRYRQVVRGDQTRELRSGIAAQPSRREVIEDVRDDDEAWLCG